MKEQPRSKSSEYYTRYVLNQRNIRSNQYSIYIKGWHCLVLNPKRGLTEGRWSGLWMANEVSCCNRESEQRKPEAAPGMIQWQSLMPGRKPGGGFACRFRTQSSTYGMEMHVHQYQIPVELIRLINEGIWSRQKQFHRDIVHKISPDDHEIVLESPPFHTIQDEVEDGNLFWTEGLTNVGKIDYSRAVIIADFGLGSDSPIILYYEEKEEASVMYLKWSSSEPHIHSWEETHKTFKDFAVEIGLFSNQ